MLASTAPPTPAALTPRRRVRDTVGRSGMPGVADWDVVWISVITASFFVAASQGSVTRNTQTGRLPVRRSSGRRIDIAGRNFRPDPGRDLVSAAVSSDVAARRAAGG